jgi:S1-C subfamily serine protease
MSEPTEFDQPYQPYQPWLPLQYPQLPEPPRSKRNKRKVIVAAGMVGALSAAGIAVGVDLTSHSNTISDTGLRAQTLPTTTPNQGSTGSGSGASGSNGSGSNGSGSTDPFGGSDDPFGGSGNPFGNGGNPFGGLGGNPFGGNGDPFGGLGGNPFGGSGGNPSGGGGGNPFGGSSSGSSGTPATAAQQVGIVNVNTVLKYQGAQAAGTGMILNSNGEVLTNNHVVDGATRISVTVVSTGKTYAATVVGTDPTDDVAVIQLQNASGLQTAKLGDSSKLSVGDAVTGVGNAGGTGTLTQAPGNVEALNQSMTATDDNGQSPEQLTGMIESNAPIQAGDSGGPLYNSNGEVVGIDTAGDGASQSSTASQAYSIPINKALNIAQEIESGVHNGTIHQGYPGILGVSIADSSANGFGNSASSVSGAQIQSVVDGSPAAGAGLAAGDVITAVNGTTVGSATDLHNALASDKPGTKVTITWTDTSGQSHSASLTLATGPAD